MLPPLHCLISSDPVAASRVKPMLNSRYRLGCVEYVNAKPLIGYFEHLGDEGPVELQLDVPSKLPILLDTNQVDAILVSSFDALSVPGRRFAEGAAVGTAGAAESVRVFSKVEPTQIKRLALDASSLTTNHMAMIVLKERYGADFVTDRKPPELDDMLRDHDAAVVIGDKGMFAESDAAKYVLDLGAEWNALTGLPFVYALWVGRERLTPELAGLLKEAERWGNSNLDEVVARTVRTTGWPFERCDYYLRTTMSYDLSPPFLAGLEEFQRKLIAHGFIADRPFPEMVRAGASLRG